MKLHKYQQNAIAKALSSPGLRWIFNDETGLGKSAEALVSAEYLTAQRVLIVCPAIVRSAWLKQLDLWWPDHLEAKSIIMGPDRKRLSKPGKKRLEEMYNAPIQIISYNLLHHILNNPAVYDVIIFDECHRLKTPKTKWSKAARVIVESSPQAAVFGLTATLMPNKPLDACGVVECIWPGRMGGINPRDHDLWWSTKKRYANAEHNGYGWAFSGVNPLHVDELRERLSAMSSRTTKLDVLHLLQTFDVQYVTVPPKRVQDYQQLKQILSQKDVMDDLSRAGMEKMQYAVEWAEDAREEVSHICILTHLRETARLTAEALEKRRFQNVYLITGAQTPERRNEILATATGKDNACVVCTMHSVGIGIDLTGFPRALFSELYYRPETVIQALGRFSRLSGKVPSHCTICSLEGTIDEVIADKLKVKIDDINSVSKAGLSEDSLSNAIGSDEDFMSSIGLVAANMVEDDYE